MLGLAATMGLSTVSGVYASEEFGGTQGHIELVKKDSQGNIT